jgi:hypothetical protein
MRVAVVIILLVQQRLADYLKEGKFTRKGESEYISSSVRLISITSMSLTDLEEQKKLDPSLLELIGNAQDLRGSQRLGAQGYHPFSHCGVAHLHG